MESAKEIASKHLGKNAINYITLLVLIGVVSSMFLESSVLPAVIGLVATSSMALIGILQHIVGAKEKEEKPEITIIKDLINEVAKDKSEEMNVDITDSAVTVTKGKNIIKKNKDGQTLHRNSKGSDNAEETKKIISNPQKSKAMKKDKPNLPASSMLKSPVSSGKAAVKKAVAKKVVKAVMKKAAKKKY